MFKTSLIKNKIFNQAFERFFSWKITQEASKLWTLYSLTEDSNRWVILFINFFLVFEGCMHKLVLSLTMYTVRRLVVKFHSTARMYMDQSLPGTESVFCFWPVLNPAPQCNFPMASENFIVEPFHGQAFSTNAHSQTWNFPLVLYINGIFR